MGAISRSRSRFASCASSGSRSKAWAQIIRPGMFFVDCCRFAPPTNVLSACEALAIDRELGRLKLSVIAAIVAPFRHFMRPLFLPLFCFEEGRVGERFGEINLVRLLKMPDRIFKHIVNLTRSVPLLKSAMTRLDDGYSLGRSHHRAPVLRIQRVTSITRVVSWRQHPPRQAPLVSACK